MTTGYTLMTAFIDGNFRTLVLDVCAKLATCCSQVAFTLAMVSLKDACAEVADSHTAIDVLG